MTASTPIYRFEHEDGYYTLSIATQENGQPGLPSETRIARRAMSRFGAFAAPLAVAAALFAPVPPQVVRRTHLGSDLSSSRVIDVAWNVDDELILHSVKTSQAEIDELNRLYEITPAEGLWIAFPDA